MPAAVTLFFALIILYSLIVVEALLVWIAWQSARENPHRGRRWFESAERWLGKMAARKGRAALAVGALALGVRALLFPLLPVREPVITDEFSYLLGADTFASGRLSNPQHPMWKHFETIHVLSAPTYMSMYQPAQGLVLAAGIRIAGHPWFGVYLSAGLMCAAICWMLQGWLPPRWALLGGLLAVLRIGLFGYWMNSYWGGAPAAIGGSLVLGALPRLMRRLQIRHALVMGLGAAILAASRPYEGGATCLGAGLVLLGWMFGKQRRPFMPFLTRFLLPMAVVLMVTGVGLSYFYYRVTGSPFRLPEQIQLQGKPAAAPIFLWQRGRPSQEFRHSSMHGYYAVWEVDEVIPELKSAAGLAWNALKKLITAWLFFLGPALTLPLLFLPRMLKYDRRMRALAVVAGVTIFAIAIDAWFYPHYAAPVTALIFAFVAQGMRHLRLWRRRRGTGLRLARAVPAICVVMIAVRLAAQPLHVLFPPAWPMTWYHTPAGNVARAEVLARLNAMDGKHLAIVRYRPDHNAVMNEWVYNRADIDGAKVVWAHEMDAAANRELIEYFRGRRAWLVEADESPPRLSPFPVQP
ncbi:MAG TPA: hypothetical protein VL285_15555 [Bryobacteraceae bacterium]|jgi:hypothetical protein|nr:hypothetical protein [Bryobacteraceae bacterium]